MERSWMPTVTGILCILSGCLALIGCLALALGAVIFSTVPEFDAQEFPFLFVRAAFAIGAAGSLLVAAVALFGGVSALARRRWGWALAGSIASTLACPPLGVPAIVLTVLAEEELRAAS